MRQGNGEEAAVPAGAFILAGLIAWHAAVVTKHGAASCGQKRGHFCGLTWLTGQDKENFEHSLDSVYNLKCPADTVMKKRVRKLKLQRLNLTETHRRRPRTI